MNNYLQGLAGNGGVGNFNLGSYSGATTDLIEAANQGGNLGGTLAEGLAGNTAEGLSYMQGLQGLASVGNLIGAYKGYGLEKDRLRDQQARTQLLREQRDEAANFKSGLAQAYN